MTYTVVTLDGKEKQNLSLEEVKDLFFRRQINQSSLISSPENSQWQMLKRAFDVSHWIPNTAPIAPKDDFAQTSQNQFDQPVTFNQPADFGSNPSNGYTQNNQSQTFYQAETLPGANKLQNIQSNYAPSHFQYTAAIPQSASDSRIGLRPAAIFLIVNALLYGITSIVEKVFLSETGNSAYEAGQGTGRVIIPLIIDLWLASRLWKNEKLESTRKWVLFRAYFGFIIFGIGFPFLMFGKGEIFGAIVMFLVGVFYLISIGLVLHGKNSPSTTRVMSGIGTFAVFCLLVFGTIGLAVLGNIAPNLSKMNLNNPQIDKYKIEGSEFQDKTTGAKVQLPENWVMLKTNNPIASSPEARMVAVSQDGQRLAMLEVVPVPAQLDMKKVSSSMILDELCNGVSKSMEEAAKQEGYFGKNSFKEITRMIISVGKHPAKLLVVERNQNGMRAKGHIIITYDELTFYVLHTWCPTNEYDDAQNDFSFIEKNFSVPEKINSVFNQSADNERKEK